MFSNELFLEFRRLELTSAVILVINDEILEPFVRHPEVMLVWDGGIGRSMGVHISQVNDHETYF